MTLGIGFWAYSPRLGIEPLEAAVSRVRIIPGGPGSDQ